VSGHTVGRTAAVASEPSDDLDDSTEGTRSRRLGACASDSPYAKERATWATGTRKCKSTTASVVSVSYCLVLRLCLPSIFLFSLPNPVTIGPGCPKRRKAYDLPLMMLQPSCPSQWMDRPYQVSGRILQDSHLDLPCRHPVRHVLQSFSRSCSRGATTPLRVLLERGC